MKVFAKVLMTIMCVAMMCGSSSAAQSWPDKIKLGLIPTEGGADIQTRFKPLIDHLETKLGLKVETFSASDSVRTSGSFLFEAILSIESIGFSLSLDSLVSKRKN